MKKIRPFINKDLIKVITGIRRSGKSVMLELIKGELQAAGVPEENMISYNFESMSCHNLRTAEAIYEAVIKQKENLAGKAYLFFDEIQEVENWERAVNSFRVDLDCDIYITGSNAKLLSGELATYLAGRYVEFIIYPLSFKEFIDMYRQTSPNATNSEYFRQYLHFGGMPYLGQLNYQEEPVRQYLQDIYNSVELKDVVKRNKIRDVDLLERIMSYVMANIGTTFSATAISKYLKKEARKVAPETILNYLHACMEAFLFFAVKRQELAGKKILSVQEKYYMADHGIRQAMLGTNTQDIGLILENIVYLELLRRDYEVTVGKSGSKEVDFIAKKQNEILYIQVSYLLA